MQIRPVPSSHATLVIALFSLFISNPAGLGADEVYFLKEPVSVTTETGVHTALAGTKVSKVAAAPGGLKVKFDDGSVVNVTMKQLTSDQKEAEQLAQEEAAKKDAVAAKIQATTAAIAAEQAAAKKKADELAQQYGRAGVNPPPQPVPASQSSGLTGSALDDKGSGTAKINHPVVKKGSSKTSTTSKTTTTKKK